MAWNEPEDETEYLEYLEHERHMLAWSLVRYSGLSLDVAAQEAMSFYSYESASDPHRGLVFHDQAWHWAMPRVHGEFYWKSDREREAPSAEYQAESKAFQARSRSTGRG
jgi:hypothetical protein